MIPIKTSINLVQPREEDPPEEEEEVETVARLTVVGEQSPVLALVKAHEEEVLVQTTSEVGSTGNLKKTTRAVPFTLHMATNREGEEVGEGEIEVLE